MMVMTSMMLRQFFLIYKNEIRPIDFSLCGFGYYLYEVADTLRYIESELRPMFMKGYCEHMILSQNYQQIIEAFFVAGAISNHAYLALNPMDFDHLSKKVTTDPNPKIRVLIFYRRVVDELF